MRRKNNFRMILMALVAMSFFKSPLSLAQTNQPKAFSQKIKTPNTSKELTESRANSVEDAEDQVETKKAPYSSPAPSRSNSGAQRRLQQHGLGLGIGQTFLLGNYADQGEDKITMDVLYSYAASYSFDLLLNAHMSEHEHRNEKMKVMGLTSSIKARVVEYDNFSPFVLGGLGFYAPRAKRLIAGTPKWTDQKVTFGLNFGGGFDLRLNDQFVVGILGQTHWPFMVKQDVGSDLKGYYFKLLITGMYLF
ncbi:MAG TPA: hypothetical protein VNJ08_17250 [Bacteriovoracaceae bacterium]|nr:hypothetical protein [Bacteriovoracaceae bacterium]